MKLLTQLSRRTWLKMVLGSVATFVFSQFSWFPFSMVRFPFRDEEILWQYVRRMFIHPGSAVVIGRKYLECRPREANSKELARLIVCNSQLSNLQTGNIGLTSFRNMIGRRIRKDFLLGHVVTLDGWILSNTELRLSSFLALKTNVSSSLG